MYVKIIDRGECFSTTMEYINGVYANRDEWAKHNFYPQNGMVGEVVKVTPRAFIVKIMEGVYVPMTKAGLREISYEEYMSSQNNNQCTGMDDRQKRINGGFDNVVGDNWEHLKDMREEMKSDIIELMKKLTFDFEKPIFLPELERSFVMYATSFILEYKRQWGSTLPPYVVNEVLDQLIDVYNQFFHDQFTGEAIGRCRMRVHGHATDIHAAEMVEKYYEEVNRDYCWH